MKRTILYAAAALLLGGCFKSVGYDTDVILKSWVQTESAAELKPAQGVVAYAFEADTVTWTVASYEDALNGVLTRKGTDEAGVSPVQGTAYRVDSVDMDLLLMRVGSTPVVVVAVRYREPALRLSAAGIWARICRSSSRRSSSARGNR